VAVLNIHPPEAETIHDLAEGIVLVEELNGAHNIEDDLGVLAHVQSVDGARHLRNVVTWLAHPGIPVTSISVDFGKDLWPFKLLMVTPIALDRIRANLASVAMLSELSVRLRLQLDHVATSPVLEAQRLDIDGSGPVIPGGVFFAVNVHVRGAILVGEFEFLELILLHTVGRTLQRAAVVRFSLGRLGTGVDDRWSHYENRLRCK
jgi:hypothetical protein